MTNDERFLHKKNLVVIAVSVVASIVLLNLLFMVGTHRCLHKTLGFGQEAMVFLETLAKNMIATNREEKPRRRTIWMLRSNRLRRSCPLVALRLTTILSSNMSMPRTFRG